MEKEYFMYKLGIKMSVYKSRYRDEMVKDRLRDMHEIRMLRKRQIKWQGNPRHEMLQGRIDFLLRQVDFSFQLTGVL